MRRFFNILWRTLLALLLPVYLAVALLNYSVVQSYLGSAAGAYFSRMWGGTVRIGSLHAMPWDHLIADELLLVAPDGDTILDAQTLRIRFSRFPFKKGDAGHGGQNVGTLDFDRVYLANAYYHFESIAPSHPGGKASTNLQFIIDAFNSGQKSSPHGHSTFTVDVGTLVLNHVHYRMDLPDQRKVVFDNGVEIPHMEFYDIRGRFKDVHVVNDDVTTRIVSLSTEERSGFKVDNISAKVHVCNHEIRVRDLDVSTPKSHIMIDATLLYDDWRVMNDYLRTVEHEAVIKPGTTVAMSDVAYWAPVLWGVDAQLNPRGTAHGTIDNLCTEGLSIDIGNASDVDLVGSIKGLPHVDSMVIDVDHLALRLERSDLDRIALGPAAKAAGPLMHWLRELEYVDLSLTGHGGLGCESTAGVNMACGLGSLQADLKAMPGERASQLAVDLGSDGLDLHLLGSDWLTYSGIELSAEAVYRKGGANGKGDIERAAVDLQAINSVVRGQRLSPIDLHAELKEGQISLQAECNDSLLGFSLEGGARMGDPERQYTADLTLQRLVPQAFGLMAGGPRTLGTVVSASLRGNSLDSLNGVVKASKTHLVLDNGEVHIGNADIELKSDGGNKQFRLESDPLSMTLGGHFAYADLPVMVSHMASQILPADLQLATAPDSLQEESIKDNTMNFSAQWNDDGTLLDGAGSDIRIAQGSRLSGSYNHRELLKLVLRSDSLSAGSVTLDNVGLSSRSAGANYMVDLETQELVIGKTPILKRLNASIGCNTAHSMLQLHWGDDDATTRGDVMLRLANGRVSVVRPDFYIGDTRWSLGIDSAQLVRATPGDAMGIEAHGISLSSGTQHIAAGIMLRQRDDDRLVLDFNRFSLGGLCSVLLQESSIEADGQVNGHFEMYGLGKTPYFNAALTVDSCIVNRQPLGQVDVQSTWNAELNTINLNLASEHLDAHGWLELEAKDPRMSFNARFDSFELALAAPFLATFSSRFEGRLHGNFDITGTLAHPTVLGEAMVDGGALKVDLTGVTYFFDDSLTFTNNTIELGDFILRDHRNNLATINGRIRYSNLDNMVLDLGLSTDNLTLLDQRSGDSFYGTLLASASGSVRGPLDNLRISAVARTNLGCNLTVPVSDLKQIKTQNYITFVGDEQQQQTAKTSSKSRTAPKVPFNIELDLDITPDMQLNLPMDFSEVTVTVNANGSGDLHLNIDEQLTPQVIGTYEIIDGSMKLGMLSLIEKNFSLENGSNLGFQGSLPDARFDLRAVYSQRVNLSTLTGSLSTIDNTQKYIQVDDIIAVAGTLKEPTIKFDLRLPNADQSIEEEVFSYIDRTSERDMISQTVSLLLLGQFANVSGNEQTAATTASSAASGGIGSIASTMGSMMADMVEFVDINVDYKAANDVTNEQLDLNISKDWGRWYLESTLGYGGESRELESNSRNGTVLDALIGYRISPLVHLFAYNRTNTNDYTRMDLPYKQGVGLKLTKDFDTWGELFGNSRQKNKKANTKKP